MKSKHLLAKMMLFCVLPTLVLSATILNASELKPYRFTEAITGDLTPL